MREELFHYPLRHFKIESPLDQLTPTGRLEDNRLPLWIQPQYFRLSRRTARRRGCCAR